MRASSARRVLGYARVSSAEQARGSSLKDQEASIRRHAKSLGLDVTEVYVEAESAVHEKFERREQIQALMRDVRRGDLVVVDKLDRWSRDAEFSYRSVREILEAGASFFAVAEQIDPSTSEGDTALSFRILFAREEHKRIKERMVGTRKILRDQGYYVEGLPPYGYRRSKPKGHKGADKNVLVVQPDEAATVCRVFRLCASGKSLRRIAEMVGLTKDRVVSILGSRVYVGEIENSRHEWIKAKHEPILDAATFLKAQDALAVRRLGGARPSDAPAETDDWILRDVAACGKCGARMGAVYSGRTKEKRHYYYRCVKRCPGPYVPVRLVELAFTPLVLDRLAAIRTQLAREPTAPTVRTAPDPEVKRAKLAKRRARYLELYADGLMDRPSMLASVAKVDEEAMRATAAAAPQLIALPAFRRAVLANVAALEHAWRVAGPKRRRVIVNQIAIKVGLVADEEPCPTWRAVEELGHEVE